MSGSVLDGSMPTLGAGGWAVFDPLERLGSAVAAARWRERPKLLDEWDEILSDVGRDPSREDWSRFRPLRLSREEDWSDWLAFLMETSTTGTFPRELLSGSSGLLPEGFAFSQTPVDREERVGERRADIAIHWEGTSSSTHIEVKLYDQAFEKTFETGLRLRSRFPDRTWTDAILLPETSVGAWDAVAGSAPRPFKVQVLTWTGVAIALRRVLAARVETTTWRVWARAFCGAIEQHLLGHPRYDEAPGLGAPGADARISSQISTLKGGRHEGR